MEGAENRGTDKEWKGMNEVRNRHDERPEARRFLGTEDQPI